MDAAVNSSISSLYDSLYLCSQSEVGRIFLSAWFVLYVLLVPVFLSVLYIGYRKCKNQRSNVSHSDALTFHMIGMELFTALAAVLFILGLSAGQIFAVTLGMRLYSLAYYGQMFFHCLTCVERYLAVVHPITYLRLKKRGGVMIRNISVGFTWLMSVTHVAFNSMSIHEQVLLCVDLLLVLLALAFVSFCSVSVLCVLIRPGPGDGGGDRKTINQSKRSAFDTIMAILGVLLTRLVHALVFLFWSAVEVPDTCAVIASTAWFCLPSSLVLPLLFLHRARKISGKRQSR